MNSSLKIILVPTDFSEVCANALNHGAVLAKSINAKLCLLHVINSDSKAFIKKEGLAKIDLEAKLDKVAFDIQKKYGIDTDQITKEGRIHI